MQDRQRQNRYGRARPAAPGLSRLAAAEARPSFDFAIAEIAGAPETNSMVRRCGKCRPRSTPRRSLPSGRTKGRLNAPPAAPRPRRLAPDFSSLERHLIKITSQIEALQRPDHIEQSIAAFRSELAENFATPSPKAMPRRAIESIENEVRSLSRRIDETPPERHRRPRRLAGIERAPPLKSAKCCAR